MKAEIIAVGTELLLGQIVNTNAQYLSQECAGLGISVYFQTVVGDNKHRLLEALHTASQRADLIICTGGLGPTQDDLTKDIVAEFTGSSLIIHEPSMEKIKALFEKRGMHMVESNARQALILEGGYPLRNDAGLAVGVAFCHDTVCYILLPGPPREMKPMFENEAKPWLRSLLKDEQPLYSKMLKFAGIGESNLEHALIDLIKNQKDPTIAPYAKEGEVTIRLTTRAGSEEEADAKMSETEHFILERVGEHLYAKEDIGLEEVILRLMRDKKLTLSAAESCTGGLFSDMITSVSGSSQVFKGGVICYSNEIKHTILNVPAEMLEGEGTPGAVSTETAARLAEQMRNIAKTDYAVAITGIAGPAELEGKPPGLVYIAVSTGGRSTRIETLRLSGNREGIKLRAAKYAMFYLWQEIKNL
jgi:nicotinamide-nucleotide amidase